MMMIRPRQKKTLDEIYGTKLEMNSKSQAKPVPLPRIQRDCTSINIGNPIYTSVAAIKDGNMTYRRGTTRPKRKEAVKVAHVKGNDKEEKAISLSNVSKDHPNLCTTRIEKNKSFLTNMEENKQYYDTLDNFVRSQATPRQLHQQMQQMNQAQQIQQMDLKQAYINAQQHQHQQHSNAKQREHTNCEEDKDDTEEFIQLIQQTVEKAVGKTITNLLNRNFRDIITKIENFSAELAETQKLLFRFQTDMNKKICHYGEENARHFRYLCMKSEYDKMFYQHQALVNNTNAESKVPFPTVPPMPQMGQIPQIIQIPQMGQMPLMGQMSSMGQVPPMRQMRPMGQMPHGQMPQIGQMCQTSRNSQMTQMAENTFRLNDWNDGAAGDNSNQIHPCTCRGNNNNPNGQQQYQPGKDVNMTDSHNISTKSSEVGVREVLDHIQRFCVQLQVNDGGNGSVASCGNSGIVGDGCGGCDTGKSNASCSRQNTYRPEDAITINKEAFIEDDDDDDDDEGTDGFSLNSMDQMHKYEAKVRMLNQRNKPPYGGCGAGGDA